MRKPLSLGDSVAGNIRVPAPTAHALTTGDIFTTTDSREGRSYTVMGVTTRPEGNRRARRAADAKRRGQ